jgi:hypothetical protein
MTGGPDIWFGRGGCIFGLGVVDGYLVWAWWAHIWFGRGGYIFGLGVVDDIWFGRGGWIIGLGVVGNKEFLSVLIT